jgi:ABC-type multidrug transport system fused ATPase/permease subunit
MKQIALNRSYLLLNKIKTCLSLLLFNKISKMTLFSIKSQTDIGGLANLLVNDMVSIEIRLIPLFVTSSFPIAIIGITTVLIIRVGWVALVGVLIVVLFIPLSNIISKHNGKIISEDNTIKDRRVDLTTDMI